MIIAENIPLTYKSFCYCGPTWKERNKEQMFVITRWNIGPKQEYRCHNCGNQAFLDVRNSSFRVLFQKISLYDMKEQAEWYSKHCSK